MCWLSLVQDPDEATVPSTPQNALFYDHVDLVFRISILPGLLQRLVQGRSVIEAAQETGARLVVDHDEIGQRGRHP